MLLPEIVRVFSADQNDVSISIDQIGETSVIFVTDNSLETQYCWEIKNGKLISFEMDTTT